MVAVLTCEKCTQYVLCLRVLLVESDVKAVLVVLF